MPRIAVTSDIHWDPSGAHTPPEKVLELTRQMADVEPDAVVIAGDLTHGLANFENCLAPFTALGLPLAVVPGNHDLWRAEETSEVLWTTALPRAARDAGAVWLDDANLVVGDVVIAGSIAWYDYSAVDPEFARPANQLGALKGSYNNDATWIDWKRSDPEFALEVCDALMTRIAAVAEDARALLVVTHMPVVEEQMFRKPGDEPWGVSNAYFGNLTLGRRLLEVPKVTKIVSGHLHRERHAWVERDQGEPVEVFVIGSDYGAPAFIVIDI